MNELTKNMITVDKSIGGGGGDKMEQMFSILVYNKHLEVGAFVTPACSHLK